MASTASGTLLVLEPEDEYCHEPEPVPNYNESMYFNVFDFDRKVGGWFRIGNRVNEGHAEMSKCIYLPDGRIAFMFKRPEITSNAEMNAGGMRFEVVTPFEHQRVSYSGHTCLLENPREMAEPRKAFASNPIVPCQLTLDYRGVAPMYGGKAVKADGSELDLDPEKSFARAHYEQHVAAEGHFQVGDEHFDVSGYGLRDKSWGPRYWQAIRWYRWLPIAFGDDFGIMISLIAREGDRVRASGMVLRDGEYVMIREAHIESEWDADFYQTRLRATARTDEREYVIEGRVLSLIPLRNRRPAPGGGQLLTRITEGMTEYTCDGRTGYGLSEYLDQIEDGRPVGADVTAA